LDVAFETMQMQRNQSNSTQQLVLALWNRLAKDGGLRMFMFGCTVAFGGIVWDSTICHIIGTSTKLYDLLTSSTCLFLGCDISFVGVLDLWCNRENDKNIFNDKME